MAEDTRTNQPSTVETNRSAMQGNGVGQRELNAQQQPTPEGQATSPERTEPFESGAAGEDRSFEAGTSGDLGEGTPANVDIHKLGQSDNPEEDWGEPAGEGAMHSSDNTRRGEKTEAERGQGAKTRAFNKDQVSRRT